MLCVLYTNIYIYIYRRINWLSKLVFLSRLAREFEGLPPDSMMACFLYLLCKSYRTCFPSEGEHHQLGVVLWKKLGLSSGQIMVVSPQFEITVSAKPFTYLLNQLEMSEKNEHSSFPIMICWFSIGWHHAQLSLIQSPGYTHNGTELLLEIVHDFIQQVTKSCLGATSTVQSLFCMILAWRKNIQTD